MTSCARCNRSGRESVCGREREERECERIMCVSVSMTNSQSMAGSRSRLRHRQQQQQRSNYCIRKWRGTTLCLRHCCARAIRTRRKTPVVCLSSTHIARGRASGSRGRSQQGAFSQMPAMCGAECRVQSVECIIPGYFVLALLPSSPVALSSIFG